MLSILESINKISYDLLVKEPFYGHLLVGIVKEEISKLYNISVGPSDNFMQIGVNATYWFLQNDEVKKGLIKHELLHITFKHPTRCRKFLDKKLAQLAADLIVNQLLDSSELPDDAFTLEILSDNGFLLETNKDLKYYYEQLQTVKQTCENACDNESDSQCDSNNRSHSNTQCNNSGSNNHLDKLLKILKDGKDMSHMAWSQFDDIRNQHQLIEHNVDTLLVTITNKLERRKMWGNTPGMLKEYLNAITLLNREKVDWKKQLRLFAQSSQKTYVKNTISRPSRRYGTTPGTKIKRRCKLLLAIDTSGSLSKEDITEYFHEIHHLWRKKVELFIVECDTEITNAYEYRGQLPKFVVGRGGTDFNAPIAYNNLIYKGDGVIYFTDGEAPTPEVKSNQPILWLIYNREAKKLSFSHLPGKLVFMD